MECVRCYGLTRVLQTRWFEGGTARRRECMDCKFRFSTEERVVRYTQKGERRVAPDTPRFYKPG